MAGTGSAFQGFHLGTGCSAAAAATTGQAGEKVKFTVSVHGHQWSSARHVHETLQEFARVIERNAKRLEFIGQGDSIQRLQLVRPDGSEPEELDVDATLEDVLICMGDKQLVAIIPASDGGGAATKDLLNNAVAEEKPSSPELQPRTGTGLTAFLLNKTETPTSYTLTPTSAPPADNESPTPGCSKNSPANYGVRGLKIPSCEYSSAPGFSDDGTLASKSVYGQGGLTSFFGNGNSTPTPAELAQFLIRGSSANRPTTNGGSSLFGHCSAAAAAAVSPVPVFPSSGCQSAFVPSIGSRPFQGSSAACPQGGAPNIALLAQFLAAQLRAFTPAQNNPAETSAKNTVNQPDDAAAAAPAYHRISAQPQEASKHEAGAKVGELQDDKDASSSSANINNGGTFSSSFGIGDNSDPGKGRSELVFLVNRRSKMGVGTHHLKMSDLSAYFHLSIVDAAKKLGVSQTTLKKACRKFGLKRWPGRKVRSLESTIHGLEHTIAVGQGAGMEDLTEAYMRSEVLKLQQEMDQLVHGVPAAQHLPMVRTADLYKRLYSRGWRSKFHSPCNRFDIDLNNHSRETTVQECSWKASDNEVEDCNRNYQQNSKTEDEQQQQQEQEAEDTTTDERTAKKAKVEQAAS